MNTNAMAKITMANVKQWGSNIIQHDNMEGVDKDPQLGSMDLVIQQGNSSVSGTLQYDEKDKQLKQMALTTITPEGNGTIEYGRVPDSSTEMAHITSQADNTDVAVVMDEKKGLYEYSQKTLEAKP